MNSLERQLPSWQLRRPSAGLKRRLFAERLSPVPRMAWFMGWMVPASACALLTFSVFSSGNQMPGRSAGLAPEQSRNQNYLALAPDSFQRGQNNLLSVTFDWTNCSGSTTTITSRPRSRMN